MINYLKCVGFGSYYFMSSSRQSHEESALFLSTLSTLVNVENMSRQNQTKKKITEY